MRIKRSTSDIVGNSLSSSNTCPNINNNNNSNNNNIINNNNNNNISDDEDCEQVKNDKKRFVDEIDTLPRLQTVTLSDDDDYGEFTGAAFVWSCCRPK